MSVSDDPARDGTDEQESLQTLIGSVFDLADKIASRISPDEVEERLRRTLREADHQIRAQAEASTPTLAKKTGTSGIDQEVTDISSADQLLRYAIAGQLELLLSRGFNQGRIAQGVGFGARARTAGAVLSKALKDGPTAEQLRGLDEIIGALAPDLGDSGGLSSLALRLSPGRHQKITESSLAGRIPPNWARKLLADPPDDEVVVLMQASALLSEFIAADKIGTPDAIAGIRYRYSREMDLLARRLIMISVEPPSARTYDAQMLLGMLASYASELVRDRLQSQLRYSPMSFRVWRAITKLVKLGEDGEHASDLRVWIRQLIRDSEGLRKDSLYPGASLDLELAITIPAAWSPPGDDWVGEALLTRARNSEATIRERGTAAMGLWQRAMAEGRPGLEKTKDNLRELITEFRDPESRPDAAAGLRWVAATLEHAINNEVAVCNDWPDVDEPWFRRVQEAADELDNAEVPAYLLTGTKNLFRHMILQNAGVYRHQAVETVVISGMNEPVARALGSLLGKEQEEAWLRIRAESALSFLQQRDETVESDLTRACEHAYASLKLDHIPEDQAPPRSHVTEMHASLFAVGDCFGVPGGEERARSVRTTLAPILTRLASAEGDRARILRRPARAAAYLLTVTAQPAHDGKPDLGHELLEKLSRHPDPVTARLSQWALSFRFAPGGTIRPSPAAAKRGEHDD